MGRIRSLAVASVGELVETAKTKGRISRANIPSVTEASAAESSASSSTSSCEAELSCPAHKREESTEERTPSVAENAPYVSSSSEADSACPTPVRGERKEETDEKRGGAATEKASSETPSNAGCVWQESHYKDKVAREERSGWDDEEYSSEEEKEVEGRTIRIKCRSKTQNRSKEKNNPTHQYTLQHISLIDA